MRKWFALKVHTCCERQVEDLLRKHLWVGEERIEADTFLPVQRICRNEATGLVERNRLVVDGIVFVCIHPSKKIINAIRNTIPRVLGFYHIVGTNTPEPIPDHQIGRFRQMLNDSPNKVELVNHLQKGDRVQVIRGNLKGLVGTLEEDPSGRSRIYVELDILGKSCRTLIDRADTALVSTIDTSSSRVAKALESKTFQSALNSFDKAYREMTGLYLRRLSDSDLVAMVDFYEQLLKADKTLPLLRTTVWKSSPYCYQHFFADVYRELAERVKSTRKREERAPLLESLAKLCDQVSQRAYTIKTNRKWVETSLQTIRKWQSAHPEQQPAQPDQQDNKPDQQENHPTRNSTPATTFCHQATHSLQAMEKRLKG